MCMGRAECRGHMHTRCDACVWRAQAPRAHTRVGVRLSEICRTRTLGRSKAAKYGREVLRGGYNTRKMYLRGSFRVQASHGAQVLRVCAPCLAAYEPSAPHPPTKSPSPLGESLLVLAHQVPSTGTSLANSLASVCAHGCRVTCTFGIGRSQGSISCTTGVHPQSSSLGDLS